VHVWCCVLWCSNNSRGKAEHDEAGAADDEQLLRGGVRVDGAQVEQAQRRQRRRGRQGHDSQERRRSRGATGDRPQRRHLRLATRLPPPPLRFPPRRAPPQRVGHPLQRWPHAGDGPHRQGPRPRQRRLSP